MSRVRTLDSLTLWHYSPSAIKITPYYKQLLQWCDSVDVITSSPYSSPSVRYPDREHDQISCMVTENESNDVLDMDCLFNTTTKVASAYSTTDHLVNTTGTEMIRNDPLQPKNCKRKAVVNSVTDCTVPKKIHTGNTKKKVLTDKPLRKFHIIRK